jgi:hypothetical protein
VVLHAAGLSQSELNTLMKEIEFYKIQKGAYPENPEQLLKINPHVWINDPLQPGDNKKGSKTFNFERQDISIFYFHQALMV